MLELKLALAHVILFLCFWIRGASSLFLANFQAVPRQSGIIFYSLASLKFVNTALMSNHASIQKSSSLRQFRCHFRNWDWIQDQISYSTFNSDSTSNNNLGSNSNSIFNSNSASDNNSTSKSNLTSNNNSRLNSNST